MVACSVLWFGCEAEQSTWRGVASYCAEPTPTGIRLSVVSDGCTLDGCESVVRHDCDADVDGTMVAVRSELVIERRAGAGCADNCSPILDPTTCELDLPDGTYTARGGDHELTFTVPLAGRACSEE